MGRKPARADDGSGGSGNGKKRMPVCNGLDGGSNFASTQKSADLPTVFHCMNGGKLVNVRFTTSQTMAGAAELLAYGTAVKLRKV